MSEAAEVRKRERPDRRRRIRVRAEIHNNTEGLEEREATASAIRAAAKCTLFILNMVMSTMKIEIEKKMVRMARESDRMAISMNNTDLLKEVT